MHKAAIRDKHVGYTASVDVILSSSTLKKKIPAFMALQGVARSEASLPHLRARGASKASAIF